MRSSFVIQPTVLVVALTHLRQEHWQCHALLPPYKVSRTSGTSNVLKYGNKRPQITVWNSLDNPDEEMFEEEASQAILDGQGGFFSVRSVRGGDDAENDTSKIANFVSAISQNNAVRSMKEGYKQRVAADPAFLSKSLLEIILAASTQYMAEVSRRGQHRILPEIDFVFAGVLTAVCGKYYSMWRVARTVDVSNDDSTNETGSNGDDKSTTSVTNWRDNVPTNAFQPTLLDGHTKPTLSSRFLAFILPMPQLFRAGVIASTIGYGFVAFLIRIRTMIIPNYTVATKPISVPLAAIYTGVFMAFVSNIRYQLLQGIVEPCLIDGVFFKIEALGGNSNNKVLGKIRGKLNYLRHLKRLVIVLVRWANGLLGSWIAIGGMKALGLQKLK